MMIPRNGQWVLFTPPAELPIVITEFNRKGKLPEDQTAAVLKKCHTSGGKLVGIYQYGRRDTVSGKSIPEHIALVLPNGNNCRFEFDNQLCALCVEPPGIALEAALTKDIPKNRVPKNWKPREERTAAS